MPKPTLEAVFEKARVLLQRWALYQQPHNHSTCVPNPAYNSLLELFEEPCGHPNIAWQDTIERDFFCPACGVEWNTWGDKRRIPPAGFVSRLPYWLALPNGALEGAMVKAVAEGQFKASEERTGTLLVRLRGLLSYRGDTKLAAAEALVEWLKGKHELS